MKFSVPLCLCGVFVLCSSLPAQSPSYKLETIPTPDKVAFEVGGLNFMPDGRLVACTRHGDVWTGKDGKWKLFATGLQEPLGLLPGDNNSVLVVQRVELTRLTDSDSDGVADRYETVTNAWGYSGNYHEYAFGPVRDKAGNLYGTLNLAHAPDDWGGMFMGSHVPYRGWCFQVTPEGKFVPFASGLRSPNGIAISPDGDIFVADNQGEFVQSNCLHWIRKGAFHGHPSSLKDDPNFKGSAKTTSIQDLDKLRKYPAIYFPYDRMGRSVAEPRFDTTGGKFGPFAGQIFIGDMTIPLLMRVTLEKVEGEFQGACYPFMRSDDLRGANRLAFGPDGSLYVGLTDRGWGGGSAGLRRVVFTGKAPMEIRSMDLTADGFAVTFTGPVDPAAASRPESYSLQHWRYEYHKEYGCPEMDKAADKVTRVELSADRLRAKLTVGRLEARRIYELNITDVKSPDGAALQNATAYYTVGHLKPRGPAPAVTDPAGADADFAVQGEYAGEVTTADGRRKFGVQVVALGGGKFRAVLYPGGLPGDGWAGDKSKLQRTEGKADAGVAVFKFPGLSISVQAAAAAVTGPAGKPLGTLAKITRTSPTLGAPPPAGATVLFDGKSADAFTNGKTTDDHLLMQGVTSKKSFGSCTLHLEFMLPYEPANAGQNRGNSGCYLQGRYEVQILDSFGLEGLNNECGGVYEISAPKVNMCFPPLTWQTYDIEFTAPRFDAAGKKAKSPRLTVRHNGVVVQDDVEVPRTTRAAPNKEDSPTGPLYLQDHGHPVRFRNVWLVEK